MVSAKNSQSHVHTSLFVTFFWILEESTDTAENNNLDPVGDTPSPMILRKGKEQEPAYVKCNYLFHKLFGFAVEVGGGTHFFCCCWRHSPDASNDFS